MEAEEERFVSAWRPRLLRRASRVLAVLAPVSLGSVLATRPTEGLHGGIVLFGVACLAYVITAFDLPRHVTARTVVMVSACIAIQVAAVLLLGYVVGALGIGFVAVLAAGVMGGPRAGFAALLVSTACMVLMAFFFAGGIVANPFNPVAVDPGRLGNGLRYSLTFFILGLVITVGATVIIQRLSASLVQAQDALRKSEHLETERRQMQQAIARNRTLESLGQLAGGIAHDFNNMLTVILSTAEAIKRTPDAAPQLVADIIDASRQSARMTAQLLAFGEVRGETTTVVGVHSVIKTFVPLLRRLVREDHSLELELNATADFVRAHQTILEQILLNLVINADQALEGAGRIRIRTMDETRSEHARLCLSVRDDGPGIAPELLGRVFDPLFSTKSEGNSGLGLATVKSAVEQCGGELTVVSTEGSGTEFFVRLPVCRAPEQQEEVVCSDAPLPSGRTVLVVDDDARVRATVVRTLKRRGYATMSASGVDDAEVEFRRAQGRVDIVLTDVVLADGSGPDVVERLRSIQPELPALYVSGYTAGILQKKGVPNRDRVVSKPFEAADLIRAIESAIHDGA